ncbi:MAG: Clp protein [Nocardioides sp.]|nr:Clp protein [Nocardioides sp.]
MFKPWRWTRSSNERAVANARVAAIECSRRRVERADVELYLSQHAVPRAAAAPRAAQHPARNVV